MARPAVIDHLRTFAFHLIDIEGDKSFPVFVPALGFQAISAPEVTLQTEQIKSGTWFFEKEIVTGAEVGEMTLTRGATMLDGEFFRWLQNFLIGRVRRRNLLLIHHSTIVPGVNDANGRPKDTAFRTSDIAGALRIPARAWILHRCIPKAYKASGDFDAMAGEVSLMDLTIKPEFINEIVLG